MMAKCRECASLFIPAKLPSLRLWPALFFACLFATSLPAAASGSYSNWIGDPSIAEARLISAVTARGDLDQMPLGLEFRLAPNWKIYWRTPGEAGLPPTINLLADGDQVESIIKWPVPKRFNSFGFDNYFVKLSFEPKPRNPKDPLNPGRSPMCKTSTPWGENQENRKTPFEPPKSANHRRESREPQDPYPR